MLNPFVFTPLVDTETRFVANSDSIQVFAEVEVGDVLVLCDSCINFIGTPTDVVPTGFTSITTSVLGGTRCTISYKIADGTEDGTDLHGLGGDGGGLEWANKILLQFRMPPVTSVATSDVNAEITTGAPVIQTISEVAPAEQRIVIASYCASGGSLGVTTATFEPPENKVIDNLGAGMAQQVRVKFCQAGDDFSFDVGMDDEFAVNCLQSAIIAPSP